MNNVCIGCKHARWDRTTTGALHPSGDPLKNARDGQSGASFWRTGAHGRRAGMAELHRCRCRSCGSRRTLPRRPEHYHRQPPCRTCGRRDWRVDKYRARVELRRTPCLCHEYPFPHRKGSGFCILNAKMTEAEYLERRGVRAFS